MKQHMRKVTVLSRTLGLMAKASDALPVSALHRSLPPFTNHGSH